MIFTTESGATFVVDTLEKTVTRFGFCLGKFYRTKFTFDDCTAAVIGSPVHFFGDCPAKTANVVRRLS